MLKNKYSVDEFCVLLDKSLKRELNRVIRKETDPFRLSLMLKKGADPNYKDGLGRNVLFYNVKNILMEHNADPWCTDRFGRTPLFYVETDYQAQMLLDNLYCDDCETRTSIEEKLPDGISWDRLMVKKLYLNHQDNDGCTALFHNDSLTKWLLERGIDTEIKDDHGCTALFYTNENGTELLLHHGANPNSIDNEGNTPLFQVESLKQTRDLVNAGAEITHRNNGGELCIDNTGDSEIHSYLILLGVNPIYEELSSTMKNSRMILQRTVKRWLAERDGFELV